MHYRKWLENHSVLLVSIVGDVVMVFVGRQPAEYLSIVSIREENWHYLLEMHIELICEFDYCFVLPYVSASIDI